MQGLEVELAGMRLRNPTMLASGIMGLSAASLRRAIKGGAGAVVAKSCSSQPREGNPNPTVVEIPTGLLNSVGLANPGCAELAEELGRCRGEVPVVASVYGFSTREYAACAQVVERAGVDAVELNLSCPNVEGTVFGYSEELAREVVEEVKRRVRVPVFAKLTADAGDIVSVAAACEDAGADGITAINTLRAMAIDVTTARPVLGNRVGGLSGACLKPVALRCVYEIAEEVSIPVIGCGGVTTGRDAVEFLLAGARAVQIGTGVLYRGMSVFRKVSMEIAEYMEEKGYSRVDELVGLAHR